MILQMSFSYCVVTFAIEADHESKLWLLRNDKNDFSRMTEQKILPKAFNLLILTVPSNSGRYRERADHIENDSIKLISSTLLRLSVQLEFMKSRQFNSNSVDLLRANAKQHKKSLKL